MKFLFLLVKIIILLTGSGVGKSTMVLLKYCQERIHFDFKAVVHGAVLHC